MTSEGDRLAVCLMGPTATGKSELGMRLARRFAGEILSVDSALVYRGMDIGTAKPGVAERLEIPHHLIDLIDPREPYSAGRFREEALAAMGELAARRRLPVLVGGTLLYFRALLQGLSPLPQRDPALRARLDAEAAEFGWPALHARLAAIDAEAAGRIHPTDSQRIQRALEVATLAGRPLSELQRDGQGGAPPGWRFLSIGLVPGDRHRLAAGIRERFDRMMEQGLLDEVRGLYRRGDLAASTPAMRAVGYRQLWAHLAGGPGLAEAREQAVAATRQLAKRQLTWLRVQTPDLVIDPFAADPWPAIEAAVAAALAPGRPGA
jgi:tRNA dimethylallyltransferase